MTTKRSSPNWSYQETKDLLDICKDRNVGARLKAKKPLRLTDLFYDITCDLQSIGYKRTLAQVIFKYKKLRVKYRESRMLKEKGDGGKVFEFYDLLHEMLDDSVSQQEEIKLTKEKSSTATVVLEVSDADECDESHQADEEEEFAGVTTFEIDPLCEASSEREMETEIRNDFRESSQVEEDYESDVKASKSDEGVGSDDKIEKLITAFRSSQKELMQTFFKQQREMQEQQLEWQRQILNEEREFFTKVLSSVLKK